MMDNPQAADPRETIADTFRNPAASVPASVDWEGGLLMLRTTTSSVAVDFQPPSRVTLALRRYDSPHVVDSCALKADRIPEIIAEAGGMLASEAADEAAYDGTRIL